MKFSRRQSHPIGMDIGMHGVRLLQIDVVNDSPRVIAAARSVWPDEIRIQFDRDRMIKPQVIAPLLSRLLSQGQFTGRECVLSMPRDICQVKNLRLPLMPLDDLIQAAQMEAMVMFGVTENDAQVQVIPAGEVRCGSETKSEAIAVCARNSDVDQMIESWHFAGFRPVALDFEPAAIYRAVERFIRRRDDEAEVNVLIEVGLRRTTVLIGRGRELSFHKSIEIGGAMLNHSVARKLAISMTDAITLRRRLADTHDQTRMVGVDPVRQAVIDGVRPIVEDIAREIALCLRYYSVNFRGQRPARVRIAGGESADPAFVQLLSNALPVPVEVAKPIANADLSLMRAADRTSALGEWTHAFGLALKHTKGGFADKQGVSRTVKAVEPPPMVLAEPVELNFADASNPPSNLQAEVPHA
jgi:type IV pilus assembly protein PilM